MKRYIKQPVLGEDNIQSYAIAVYDANGKQLGYLAKSSINIVDVDDFEGEIKQLYTRADHPEAVTVARIFICDTPTLTSPKGKRLAKQFRSAKLAENYIQKTLQDVNQVLSFEERDFTKAFAYTHTLIINMHITSTSSNSGDIEVINDMYDVSDVLEFEVVPAEYIERYTKGDLRDWQQNSVW